MKRLIAMLACTSLIAGCSDLQLQNARARHFAYVCSHQESVSAAARVAIVAAPKIKDEKLRAATVAVAQGELDLILTCPTTAG